VNVQFCARNREFDLGWKQRMVGLVKIGSTSSSQSRDQIGFTEVPRFRRPVYASQRSCKSKSSVEPLIMTPQEVLCNKKSTRLLKNCSDLNFLSLLLSRKTFIFSNPLFAVFIIFHHSVFLEVHFLAHSSASEPCGKRFTNIDPYPLELSSPMEICAMFCYGQDR